MKKSKLILSVLAIITFLFSFNIHEIYADEELMPSEIDSYNSYDYVIDSYDVHIVVNEDNTFDITETITAYFHKPKHGIIRSIPLKNTVERLDGTTSENKAYVRKVSVNDKYKKSKSNDNYEIQIGSANRTVTGKQTYVINYQYGIGNDPLKDYDELYFNIIGNDWDTVIGNITFTIEMPKDFDESKLGFSSGNVGSTNSEKVSYTVEDTKIIGNYQGILRRGQALTVRCELPEGYFTKSFWNIYSLLILSLAICAMLWAKDKIKYPIVKTVEFYPPEGLNSLYVGFLYKKGANVNDVTSLLIYLANKGYVSIREQDDGDFKIIKMKEYDGNDENERLFLKGLFKNADFITANSLYNKFYRTEDEILSRVNSKEYFTQIFGSPKFGWHKSILGDSFLLLLLILIIDFVCPSTWKAFVEGIIVIYYIFLGAAISIKEKESKYIWAVSAVGMLYFLLLLIKGIWVYDEILLLILGMGVCIFTTMMIKVPVIKDKNVRETLGKLLGFRKFLKIARKEELEDMVMQNPNYFYDILPYTYVLGVSDKWIKKFETISLQAPTWYDRPNDLDITFKAFMNNMVSVQKSMTSVRRTTYSTSFDVGSYGGSSSGGSSSSGGGFSGGGSGGGGGRSW